MKDNKHEDFDWAKDKNQKERHISEIEVIRGRGYTCIECGQEMIAKKSDLELRRHHFAHFAVDVINKGKCTFSNETYRHKIAKDILQMSKKIKVPSLYKFPPSDYDGKPNKLEDSKFIEAGRVEIQMQFYENKSGKICWGRNNNEEDDKIKYNLFEPDVSFFDESGNPILLIEIVATHDVDKDKLFKIQSLGIDTIKVKIPRGSKEEIENTFLTTNNTEWVYNYERESTEYIRIPKRSDDAVSSINQFQRRIVISGESYECKKARISNLIRKINGCLESEQFRNNQETTTKELQRVEENTERNRIRLRELQERHEGEIEKEFESERERLDKEEAEIIESEGKFREYKKDLERRYKAKGDKLRESQEGYRGTDQDEIDRIEGDIRESGAGGLSIEEEERRIEIEEERIRQNIISFKQQERGLDSAIEGNRVRQQQLSEQLIQQPETFEEEIARIQREYDSLREDFIRKFENRDFEPVSTIGQRIEKIIQGGKLLDFIESSNRKFNEFSNARKNIKSETWRDWDWS
jgi:hypothetical protein